jgi:haloalkane dehalogenase
MRTVMKILRTPDSQFEHLDGYAFAPHYTTISDADGTPIRIHRIDEGPRDAEPIVLMHGNPTWSYLHRHMIPGLVATGRRVIAVDLVGCGRSDKPAAKSDYTLARHIDWMTKWLLAEDLQHITLYCQDWGGTIGLHLVANHPARFDRVVASNTGMPLGEGASSFVKMWTEMMDAATEFPWDVLPPGMTRVPTAAELAAYRAPFPSTEYEAGILQFPALIAVQPENPGVAMNRAAWERLASFTKPFLTLFGGKDRVARGADRRMQEHIPGAAGQPHLTIEHANHFIQEDAPEILVQQISSFLTAK